MMSPEPENLIVLALASMPLTIPLAAMIYALAKLGRDKGEAGHEEEDDIGNRGQDG